MLSNSQIKYYSSLRQKKFRKKYGRFLAEGEKIVREILNEGQSLFTPVSLIAVPGFLSGQDMKKIGIEFFEASGKDLKRISTLETPNKAVIELKMPTYSYDPEAIKNDITLFYDDIRDPGNLGTIIRTADWFGIRNIFCSSESVDPFNPKVIQSSMGSFLRVKVQQVNRSEFLSSLMKRNPDLSKIATVIHAPAVYQTKIPSKAVIFFGNESKGLSSDIIDISDFSLSIPSWEGSGAESLNLGISTAIICSEFRRQELITRNEN